MADLFSNSEIYSMEHIISDILEIEYKTTFRYCMMSIIRGGEAVEYNYVDSNQINCTIKISAHNPSDIQFKFLYFIGFTGLRLSTDFASPLKNRDHFMKFYDKIRNEVLRCWN